MPQRKPKLTPLAARKQLLLLESQLNRDQLVTAIQEWRDEFHRSKALLSRISSVASMATRALATVSTVKRLFSRGRDGAKKSWLSYLFDGLSTGASLWSIFQSQRNKHDDSIK
jgi:hypothetical protein